MRHSLIRYTVLLSAGTLLGSHLNPLTLDFESSAGDFWWNNTTVFCAFQTIIVNTYISTSLLLVYHTSFKLFASVFGEPFGKPYCFSPVWPAAVPSRESSVTVKFLAASFKGEVVRVGRMDHYQTPRSMERCRPFFFFFISFFFLFFFPFLGTGERELRSVNAKPETGAECASRSHVSTGGTLVLTIRPRGPVFVFAAPWYCSAAKFNLGGICKQCGEACGACASVCVDEQVCLYVRACGCVCVFESDTTPQWSMALCTEFLISGGIHTFQTLLSVFIYLSNYLFLYLLLTTIQLDKRLYFEAFLFWTEDDAKL